MATEGPVSEGSFATSGIVIESSVVGGNSAGVQLFGSLQSVSTDPFQVRLAPSGKSQSGGTVSSLLETFVEKYAVRSTLEAPTAESRTDRYCRSWVPAGSFVRVNCDAAVVDHTSSLEAPDPLSVRSPVTVNICPAVNCRRFPGTVDRRL